MYEKIGARWNAIRERYKWCRRSTERITPHRLQREKRNAKAERWERPQRKAVSAYFGRETIVWCNPGRISPRWAQDEGGTPKLRESRRPFYKSPLWACTHYGGHFVQDLGFDTVEAFIKHVLENLDNATLDKKHKNGISYFVFTKPSILQYTLIERKYIP